MSKADASTLRGTVEQLLPGGTVTIRDAATCKSVRFDTHYDDDRVYDRLYRLYDESVAAHRPVNVVVEVSPTLTDALGMSQVTSAERWDSSVDQTARCTLSLGVQHVVGVMTPISTGNLGAAFDFKTSDGKPIGFAWKYSDSPLTFEQINAFRCEPLGDCTLKRPRVRVTYKIVQDGVMTRLVPLHIDQL